MPESQKGGDSRTMTTFDRLNHLLDLFRLPGETRKGGKKKSRRQTAAVIFRGSGDARELLLVTSRDTGRWIVPKGWIEEGENGIEAALRETWEEAGVVGEAISDDPVGRFRYLKEKDKGRDTVCDVDVYLFRLVEELEQWPEKNQRRRKWFPVATAIGLVAEEGLKDVIREAFRVLKAA